MSLTVASLKRRLTPGTRLRLTHSLMGPSNKLRVVAGSNTAAVWFTGDGVPEGRHSYLYWPKAKDLIETPDGFAVMEGGTIAAQYVWESGDLGCCPVFGALDENMLYGFTGTEAYYRFSPLFRNVVLTDGAMYVAKNGGSNGAYWLMDAIASQIPVAARKHPMCRDIQFWTLKTDLKKHSAVLTCVPDSGMDPVVTQRFTHTDFDLEEIKFYVEPSEIGGERVWVILLPSEH